VHRTTDMEDKMFRTLALTTIAVASIAMAAPASAGGFHGGGHHFHGGGHHFHGGGHHFHGPRVFRSGYVYSGCYRLVDTPYGLRRINVCY